MYDFRRKPQPEARSYYLEKIFSNALEKNKPFSTPIFMLKDIVIEPQQSYKVIDQTERGELIYLEVAVNSPLIIVEIILYDERLQPITVDNNKSFIELLQLGRGMTPGRVDAAATGRTQDEEGFFLTNMFHIARYKDDVLADWTANNNAPNSSEPWYVGRFVASIPFPYHAISVYIKNTTTDGNKKVYYHELARTVYEAGGNAPIIENPNPQSVEVQDIALLDESEVNMAEPEDVDPNYDSRP